LAVVAVTGTTDFTNSGLMEKEASTGTSVIDAVYTGTGTVLVRSGTLDFADGGSASASAFTVAAGTNLEFDGGTVALDQKQGAGLVLKRAPVEIIVNQSGACLVSGPMPAAGKRRSQARFQAHCSQCIGGRKDGAPAIVLVSELGYLVSVVLGPRDSLRAHLEGRAISSLRG
jgi:hypothetical protein